MSHIPNEQICQNLVAVISHFCSDVMFGLFGATTHFKTPFHNDDTLRFSIFQIKQASLEVTIENYKLSKMGLGEGIQDLQ